MNPEQKFTSPPSLVDQYRALGIKSYLQKQFTSAIDSFRHLILISPTDVEAHLALGICRLLAGDFVRGWTEYEWRLKTKRMAIPPIASPRWDGQPLDGKTILIISEQGFGDAIQFVRYARYVKERNCRIIVLCRQELSRLLAGSLEKNEVISYGTNTSIMHDVHIPMMSLPGIFQTSLNTIPANVPYLKVAPDAGANAIAAIMANPGLLRVGLVWASNASHDSINREGKSLKSLTIEQFSILFNSLDIKFFSLQKGAAAAELVSTSPDTIIDLAPFLNDFADTAAAIQMLDLVISVDTAVAHLAGALGKPVWTLIPFLPDWRWMIDREDSPWYPTMRLFRQLSPDSSGWLPVIARVATELTDLVQVSRDSKNL